ncbi:hypothetical protein BZA77DRAFT_305009 [Pyronema omphalodes]|nr:hypothetical protein BZA77DRAFT_305009 [Pyronema omphalodes]
MERKRPSPRIPYLPMEVVANILKYLPTTSIFTASLVCSDWRKLLYNSGAISQELLRPHLSVLRERYGAREIPQRLLIGTIRKLLTLYAHQDLFGTFSSTTTYDITALASSATWTDSCHIPLPQRRFALCGTLLVYAVRNKRLLLFDTSVHPMKLLTSLRIPARPLGLAVSESYLAVIDEKRLHLYHLLARGTPSFIVVQRYSIVTPFALDPIGIAITSEGPNPPLVAILGHDLQLIHPSYAVAQKRDLLFRKQRREKKPARQEWIIEAPGTSIGITTPISFGMRGRQLAVRTTDPGSITRCLYLGSAWSSESPGEVAKRRSRGIKDGQPLMDQKHDADTLWAYYSSRTQGNPPVVKWSPKQLNTGEREIDDAVHIWDSYYILTEMESRNVVIATVTPYQIRIVLYRKMGERAPHCGYAVFRGTKIMNGRKIGGYIAFCPSEGRLNVLPLERIPWNKSNERPEYIGWELKAGCRDIAIGSGEIMGMFAGAKNVVIMFEHRVVIVRLWTLVVGGVEEPSEWAIDKRGVLHKDFSHANKCCNIM